MSDTLGCGTYRVLAHTRADLAHAVVEIDFSTLDWSRVLDDTSDASILVGAEGCRAAGVADLRPWRHQLAVYRTLDGTSARVWSGPLTGITPEADGLRLSARDLSAWFGRRLVHDDQEWLGAEIADIFEALFDDAMTPDPIEDFTLTIQPTGVLGDREVLADQHVMADQALSELAGTGIDWTVIDRVMLAGGQEVPTDPVANLIDESFATTPEPSLDGLQQANRVIVSGSGGGAEGDDVFGDSGAPGVLPPEGLLEAVVSEPQILDSPSADEAALSQVALLAGDQLLVQGSPLVASARVPLESLVPGARVRLSLAKTWTPVAQVVRLSAVRVSAGADGSETVTPEFQPLGALIPVS